MHLPLLALVMATVLLAGCTGFEPTPVPQAYGAYYAVKVDGGPGCTVTVPYPVVAATAWADLTLKGVNGTQAKVVASEKGAALELAGTGALNATATAAGPQPTPASLSLQDGGWTTAGARETGSFWVRAVGCSGARLDILWIYDAQDAGVRVGLDGTLVDGWQKVTGLRVPLAS